MNKLTRLTLLCLIPAALMSVATALHAGEQTNLKLFDKGADWKFIKNTGEGSMEVATDGDKPIGVLKFDFTNKTTEKTAYVLAQAGVNIPDTAGTFQMQARSTVAKRVTLRFVDETGQTLQVKPSISASGNWETITIMLDKKMEHWNGANDGKVHFPIKSILISIPEPGDAKTGTIEFTDAVTIAK